MDNAAECLTSVYHPNSLNYAGKDLNNFMSLSSLQSYQILPIDVWDMHTSIGKIVTLCMFSLLFFADSLS